MGKTINDLWDEFALWLEAQGHDEEPIFDNTWIGHPDKWSSEDVPEPPENWKGEYWETICGKKY